MYAVYCDARVVVLGPTASMGLHKRGETCAYTFLASLMEQHERDRWRTGRRVRAARDGSWLGAAGSLGRRDFACQVDRCRRRAARSRRSAQMGSFCSRKASRSSPMPYISS